MPGNLVALIEANADALTERLVKRLRSDPRTLGYRRFDDLELGRRAGEVYRNLGAWIRHEKDLQVQEDYERLGRARREEGVPLSDVVAALLLTRRNLWDFAEAEPGDTVLDLRNKLDLELLVVRFFDRAIFHAVKGYAT